MWSLWHCFNKYYPLQNARLEHRSFNCTSKYVSARCFWSAWASVVEVLEEWPAGCGSDAFLGLICNEFTGHRTSLGPMVAQRGGYDLVVFCMCLSEAECLNEACFRLFACLYPRLSPGSSRCLLLNPSCHRTEWPGLMANEWMYETVLVFMQSKVKIRVCFVFVADERSRFLRCLRRWHWPGFANASKERTCPELTLTFIGREQIESVSCRNINDPASKCYILY